MKKFFSLMMAMTLCWVSAEACMKKSPASTELTVIVMDTTQALLPGAQVKIGKQVYKTSFDGRVVLKPEQVTSNVLTVSCKGYKDTKIKDYTVELAKGNVLLVSLTPKASKNRGGKDGVMVRGTGSCTAQRVHTTTKRLSHSLQRCRWHARNRLWRIMP